jgi:multidrug efflux pump subunit AcrB
MAIMKSGPIAWFVRNHVAANLLMILIIVGGFAAVPFLRQSFFPDMELELIGITVAYPGAAPEEVEEGVCIRIEEAVASLEGVDTLDSISSEDTCLVTVGLLASADINESLSNIKNAVDGITTFPEEAERARVSRIALAQPAVDIAITGNASEGVLKEIGEQVRDALMDLPEISRAELAFVRPYEISIEVSESSLRRYGLTFDDVAQAVRESSLDLPGGALKTTGGEILLRTRGQAYLGLDFESIVVVKQPNGKPVYLQDVAKIIDGFEEIDNYARFDGEPAVVVRVSRTSEEDTVAIGTAVAAFIEDYVPRLPSGIKLTVWRDQSVVLRGRVSTLMKNARLGLLLVLLTLCLFLKPRVAFWVGLGVPIAVLGGVASFVPAGLTVNIISLFGLILVIGLLVDDAIVVAESIHTHEEEGLEPEQAAIVGTRAVSMPVICGVLTTIATFTPLLFVPTAVGKILYAMAAAVIGCLVFSLIESQLVLPSHLASGKPRPYLYVIGFFALLAFGVPVEGAVGVLIFVTILAWWWPRGRGAILLARLSVIQGFFADGLLRFARDIYRPFLKTALDWRYTSIAAVIGMMIVTLGVIGSGYLRFIFLDSIEGDNVIVELTMPQGTPDTVTLKWIDRIEATLDDVYAQLDERYGEGARNDITHTMVSVGSQPFKSDARAQSPTDQTPAAKGGHVGEIMVELLPADQRRVDVEEVAQLWRDAVGSIPGAVELTFSTAMVTSGEAVAIRLQSSDSAALSDLADRLKTELAGYAGVYDIAYSFRGGKQELELTLRDSADSLGLNLSMLATQVRQAFYGEQVQKIQRGRDEVKVMVRYPREDRRSIGDLESMRIRSPDGSEVPFPVVARASLKQGFSSITRSNRKRAISVTAKVDPAVTSGGDVTAAIMRDVLPVLMTEYPAVSYAVAGEQRTQQKAIAGLGPAFLIALIVVYSLLAVPLRSYLQPLVIMSAIPFGLVGAAVGHLIMGFSITFLSFTGLIALAGIVVNGSLVLVVAINRAREAGASIEEAVISAGQRRFRPIVLTSLTTFVGLAPLMFAQSLEAHFLAPMAISIAFGVLFSTVLTLLAVPCGYLICEDLASISPRLAAYVDLFASRFIRDRRPVMVHPIPEGVVLDARLVRQTAESRVDSETAVRQTAESRGDSDSTARH